MNRSHIYASRLKIAAIHDAIRTWGDGARIVKVHVTLPEFKFPLRLEDFLDHFQHLRCRDEAGVGDIVGAEGHALFPAGERGGDELVELLELRVGKLFRRGFYYLCGVCYWSISGRHWFFRLC